ncbi:hypothetical protein CSUI_009770 [Cystoisospora suis]|uniref:Transmembrane protein n=1 Tax=Cystoisospora suis TaxID=483139 RepID=A0A2C6KIV1_9APIC|nr:hypothetical protein CSUI_009770 [Cystoisospora suis]
MTGNIIFMMRCLSFSEERFLYGVSVSLVQCVLSSFAQIVTLYLTKEDSFLLMAVCHLLDTDICSWCRYSVFSGVHTPPDGCCEIFLGWESEGSEVKENNT